MNPFRKNDVQNQLVKVIKEDKEISDKKRDELLDYYNNGQEGRFLGEVFLYVVNRPNKPGEDDSGDRFFFDVGKEAVICIRSPGQGEPEPDGEYGHLHWISMGGRLTLAILLAVAEIERENIQIQFMSGKMQEVLQGGWAGGLIPYRYRSRDGELVIEPSEA